ncbi:ScbA/BarX family gamma-butyrolactone biosynthesis protein (plasmid) [Streptomyces sp. FXJ1.172]|uniref:ScbA/BarX family gamma-butyrolactone biosynthesis protein n=1 Tax=Streptomyces sp. FXJ1.172 TaxID=710705 RepID=UPI0023DD181B|nr:ScbA/BarX family gamma-butyrolactone biosynthesis protein [Streptomyces sp. FXJ1.172]WEP01111.1 ScbA/BarX family gamma-butyrolactone biosynthesis protein [Streptomyces sp. FXJ1.172]
MSVSTFRVESAIASIRCAESDLGSLQGIVEPRYTSLTTTVPKEFVHRASIAEVMLTDWDRVDEQHFTVSAQWPRLHSFFATLDGYHDPLLVAETIRQAGLLVAHTEFGVPLGHQFLMWDLSVDLEAEQLRIGAEPAAVAIEIACSDIKRRGKNLAGLHFDAVIHRDGRPAGTAAATFTCASPAVYERLRAPRIGDTGAAAIPLTSPVAPQDVGRLSPTSVVLSPVPARDSWQLRVDTRHPVLFDHPVDHVPGMVLLEAARQATIAFLGRDCLPVAVTSEFTRYAELSAPCLIEACALPPCPRGRERVLVTGRQDGAVVFTSTVAVAPATV